MRNLYNKNINRIPKPVAFVGKKTQQSAPCFSTSYAGRYTPKEVLMRNLKILILLIMITAPINSEELKKDSSIGYPTVSIALESLRKDPNASVSNQGDWIIINIENDSEKTLWSFTPKSHPAHPAAIKRTIYEKDGHIGIGMKALCQASKKECDKLIEQFKELNENIKRSMATGV